MTKQTQVVCSHTHRNFRRCSSRVALKQKQIKPCRLKRFGGKLNVVKPRKSRVREFGVAQLRASIILVTTHERKTRENAGRSRLPESLRHECVARVWRQNPTSRDYAGMLFVFPFRSLTAFSNCFLVSSFVSSSRKYTSPHKVGSSTKSVAPGRST
jgi:hypothetical protein